MRRVIHITKCRCKIYSSVENQPIIYCPVHEAAFDLLATARHFKICLKHDPDSFDDCLQADKTLRKMVGYQGVAEKKNT